MVTSARHLEKYPDLIQGFDHLRAGRFFEPGRLLKAVEATGTAGLVSRFVPNWAEFSQAYDARLSKTRLLSRAANFLKVFELSVLATYVTLLGINLFQEVPWMERLLPWATLFVFLFFGFVYGITFFMIDKPTERFLQEYHRKNKKFGKGLYTLVCKCIEILDEALLNSGTSAAEYGFQLYAKDYPGIFVTTKPGRVGDRFYRAVPYPLHAVFVENRSRIEVLMLSYRDDRLLRALADLPGGLQTTLVATQNIADHAIFKSAIASLHKKNPRSTVYLISVSAHERVVAVFTVDGAWQLVFGRSLRPNELKYAPIPVSTSKVLKERFNQGVAQGDRYRPEDRR